MARYQSLFKAWKDADISGVFPKGRFEKPGFELPVPDQLDFGMAAPLRLSPQWRTDVETLHDDLQMAGLVTLDGLAATVDDVSAQIAELTETPADPAPTDPTPVDPTPTPTNPEDLYIVSDWPAGQTSRIQWSPDNVVFHDDGTFDLILRESPEGAQRPYTSGEVASVETATYGKWEWQVQIPEMVSGSVFGMFLYQADHRSRRLEYDIEFVGDDTRSLEINIHMQDEAGHKHFMIGGPITVDLPFDAAQGMHSYEIEVLENQVVFRVDGEEIGRYGPEDMPQGVWRTGEMRAYTDLWAVNPGGQEYWAGVWPNPTEPLVAKVGLMDGPADNGPLPDPVPEPEPVPDGTILGTDGDDELVGTDGDDRIDALGGDDVIRPGAGNDTVFGGDGDDRILHSPGNNVIDGGAGEDWLVITARGNSVIDLAKTTAQNTGMGNDTFIGIEHVAGGRGNDSLSGSNGANHLDGGAGNDRLWGREGADTLTGGLGRDRMDAGKDNDADVFIFRSAAESPFRKGDVILNFGEEDVLDLTGLAVNGPLSFSTSGRAANSVWTTESRRGTEVFADIDGDARPDFQVTLWDGFSLTVSDVLL